MKQTGVLILITGCLAITMSCCPEKMKDEAAGQPVFESALYENLNGIMIVDTIMYDVLIKNPNPYDDWTEECLRHLNKDRFVDILFESVYQKKATAYDVLSEDIITPDKLKKLEKNKDFDRDKIGKIQFTESWIYNDSLQSMLKKVISVSLGYEVFDDHGDLIGHKPAFKIYLN